MGDKIRLMKDRDHLKSDPDRELAQPGMSTSTCYRNAQRMQLPTTSATMNRSHTRV
jgi:hypothetical protein